MTTFQPDFAMPRLRTPERHGIGVIGAGGIVRYGHLPAYRKAGFRVVGIASRDADKARSMAGQWGIPQAFTDWRQLLDLPEVTVADVTYPFDEERLEIVRAAAERGKHILMQKPMAHSPAAAEEMVRLCREHGVRLAVNQNARWAPAYRAAWQAVRAGLIGDMVLVTHEMQNNQDSQEWFNRRWYAQQARFVLMEYSVHHIDLLRYWTGQEPVRVRASVTRKPGQVSQGDMLAMVQMEFAGGALGLVLDNDAAYPKGDIYSRFRLEGTRGLITGEAMAAPGLRIQSDLLEGGECRPTLAGAWFPDAFQGTMGELLCAIEDGREPSNSGTDNLKTLRIVFDAYRDAER